MEKIIEYLREKWIFHWNTELNFAKIKIRNAKTFKLLKKLFLNNSVCLFDGDGETFIKNVMGNKSVSYERFK